MERAFSCAPPKSALLSSSPLCSRFPTRSWHDENPSSVGLLINYVEGHGSHHLQMACLALHRTDSYSWKGPVLGFVHSLPSTQTATAALFCHTKPRDQACQCSAKRRSSARGPARFKYLKENFDAEDARDPQDVLCFEEDGVESEQLLPAAGNGTTVRPSVERRLANGMNNDEILASEGVDQNDRTNWNSTASNEGTSIPVKEPIYEVLEVKVGGSIITKSVSRRRLLKTSGLRLRDIRSVDPSLWVTNSAPALLIRDHAVLLNLGSLRAIASADSVLLFDYKSIGATAFLDSLHPRLNPDPGVPTMPFELEVVEAALLSRTQRLERRLMEVEPRVLALLKVLPNRMTANVLEELRLSKQALVELGSKANALRQMLLELLESPQEIRRMTIMGRRCTISKADGRVECVVSADKQLAHEEEEEMEMLLENYLQRCESCHGQAERLLDSSKEMEDSIAVNLSSRRLEVSRLELLLQVGTFCSALGALVAGIFGMNLKSYLEENVIAFWCTSAGIILGGIVLFFLMYNHLKQRKIL